MKNVRDWFENNCWDFDEFEGHFEGRTDTARYLVVEPHEGNGNKWLLRISTIAAFDRWANSRAIEKFFDTETELCEYLKDHQLEIYQELVEYLSTEYDELEVVCENTMNELEERERNMMKCPYCNRQIEKKSGQEENLSWIDTVYE